MASRFFLPFLFLFLSVLTLSLAIPSQNLLDAADVLSDSGFIAMGLTLSLLSKTLAPQSRHLTIFSPNDHAFAEYGQPSLYLLQFHLSPYALSLKSLKSLPPSSTIPTLLPDTSLTVTSSPSDDYVSLNGVKIDGSPVYDDGSLIIFGIHEFFDPGPDVLVSRPNSTSCVPSVNVDDHSFGKASSVLRAKGYSVMASFLAMQLMGRFKATTKAFTLFAPLDDALKVKGYIGNFSEYPSIIFRHVLPCKISWADLQILERGTVLGTNLEGFKVKINKSGNNTIVNEVFIASPDLYFGESVVVHGLQDVLAVPERPQRFAESPSPSPSDNALDLCEF